MCLGDARQTEKTFGPDALLLRTLRRGTLCALLLPSPFGSSGLLALQMLANASVKPPPSLEWRVPEPCTNEPSTRGRLQELLDMRSELAAEVRVHAVQTGQEWQVRLQIQSAGRTIDRTFEASDCATALEATALVAEVTFDAWSSHVEPDADPAPSQPIAEESRSVEVPEPDTEPRPDAPMIAGGSPVTIAAEHDLGLAPSSTGPTSTNLNAAPPGSTGVATTAEPPPGPQAIERRVVGFLSVDGGFSVGLLPSIAGLLELGGGIRWRWVVVELHASRHFPRSATFPTSDGRVEVGIWGGGVRLGGEPRLRRVSFPILVGFVLGDMVGRGVELDGAKTGHSLWGAVQLETGVRWVPVPRLAIGLRPKLLLSWTRPRFGLAASDGEGTVGYQPPGVASFALTTGLEVRL